MTRLILTHLMDGVMNCIQAQLLGTSSQFLFAFAGAMLRYCTQLDIFLGIGINYFAQQLLYASAISG